MRNCEPEFDHWVAGLTSRSAVILSLLALALYGIFGSIIAWGMLDCSWPCSFVIGAIMIAYALTISFLNIVGFVSSRLLKDRED